MRLLKAAGLLLSLVVLWTAAATAQTPPKLVTEEFMVPSGQPGIQIYVRNKHPEGMASFSPERTVLQTMIDASQVRVNGWVRVKLYKGNVIVVGRDSKSDSLFDSTVATFEEDRGAYDQKDATGFIKLNALRMRIETKLARKRKK